MRRSSWSAERPVASMAISAFFASCGWVSMTCAPTPACTVMTLIAWATTSCSSWAIRRRSSASTRRSISACSCSRSWARSSAAANRSRRDRIVSPSTHTMLKATVFPTTSPAVKPLCSRVSHRTTMAAARIEPASAKLRRRP